ncbi:MAG: protease [Bacteroidetes bacterium]|nr:MAG: protease [Bacteroidota bacterium]
MVKHLLSAAFLALFAAGFFSCVQKNEELNLTKDLPIEVQQKIQSLGFNPENAFATEGGYIVEGDILLTDAELNTGWDETVLRVGESEQYRTTNLVTGTPRTIVVTTSGSNITAALSQAIDDAIDRYNAENLSLTFVRGGSSGGGNINIRVVNTGQYIASAGFPSGGDPYNTIKYAKKYNNYSNGFMTTVIAHEMGHCIGFRHTDYMDRSYSCGGSYYNEGAAGVGAINIPGTPTGPDPDSWMLSCLSASTNRPFNNNDKTALDYLY